MHCMSIEEADPVEEQPWYHVIKAFLESGSFPPGTSTADRRTLEHLASKYVLGVRQLYRRSYNQMLLRCLSKTEADTLMLQVHAGTCGPHMNGVLLAKKIMLKVTFGQPWRQTTANLCADVIITRSMGTSFMFPYSSYIICCRHGPSPLG